MPKKSTVQIWRIIDFNCAQNTQRAAAYSEKKFEWLEAWLPNRYRGWKIQVRDLSAECMQICVQRRLFINMYVFVSSLTWEVVVGYAICIHFALKNLAQRKIRGAYTGIMNMNWHYSNAIFGHRALTGRFLHFSSSTPTSVGTSIDRYTYVCSLHWFFCCTQQCM